MDVEGEEEGEVGFEEVLSVSGVLEVSVSEVGVVRVEGIDEMSAVKVVAVRGVVGLEVSSVKGESVLVERVSVVSLVEGMLVRGGALVGAVEVVESEVLLPEKPVKAHNLIN